MKPSISNPFHPFNPPPNLDYIEPGFIAYCITCNTLIFDVDKDRLESHIQYHKSFAPIGKDMPELDRAMVTVLEPSLNLIPFGEG